MTRELFRDGLGNPIVLTLATDQRLRLIYRYKVTVSPTSPQNVSVNIGGDGPGVRTAKFLLTGVFSIGPNYFGLYMIGHPTYLQRRGDLFVAETLARGALVGGAGAVGLASTAAPLVYIHSTFTMGTASPNKPLSYNAPSGRSRQASVLLQVSEYVMTIKSVILNSNLATNDSQYTAPCGNLVFDDGQEFTKDNLHKLLIAYWQVTWGPL
jgi:hypothetical protein